MRSPLPSLENLTNFSESSLEGFELARLDEISQLRREIQEIHEEWIEAEVAARLARLLLEGRRGALTTEPQTLASPDPIRVSAKFQPGAPPALPSPSPKNGPSSLLARDHRKHQAGRSLPAGVPTAVAVTEIARLSDPADRCQPAASTAQSISQPNLASRRIVPRSRKRLTMSPKIQRTKPFCIGVSRQLALFEESHSAPELPLSQQVGSLPGRAILCLAPRPLVLGRCKVPLCTLPAAS